MFLTSTRATNSSIDNTTTSNDIKAIRTFTARRLCKCMSLLVAATISRQQPQQRIIVGVSSFVLFRPVLRRAAVTTTRHRHFGSKNSNMNTNSKVEDLHQQNDELLTATANVVAKFVSATQTSLNECGERLRSGHLVSFPTETVYGLGCHALDPIAVQKVFDAKERPLSDPLIVHVNNAEDALNMWSSSTSASYDSSKNSSNSFVTDIEGLALAALTSVYFPGPLTIVAKACSTMPQILMAGTGYVACRSPSHSVARALINAACVPIAAPSANKFGHVSPTCAQHVMDDLGQEDVWIIDPSLGMIDEEDDNIRKMDDDDNDGSGGNTESDQTGVCQVGVESTVVKVEMNPPDSSKMLSSLSDEEILGNITILRHGAISVESIRKTIKDAGLSRYFHIAEKMKFTSEASHNVAPGQMIKHYSPNVPTFMIGRSRQQNIQQEALVNEVQNDITFLDEEQSILSKSVIIDYGGRLVHYKPFALVYRDLSPDCDPATAASILFETLRWSETIDGAIRVFVPELVLEGEGVDPLVLAVKDKLTRAASAVIVERFQ
jgi:tRNA A37 threonylcarbamoyladenosine synthetase subunit TsaC/SUA5/YrdC